MSLTPFRVVSTNAVDTLKVDEVDADNISVKTVDADTINVDSLTVGGVPVTGSSSALVWIVEYITSAEDTGEVTLTLTHTPVIGTGSQSNDIVDSIIVDRIHNNTPTPARPTTDFIIQLGNPKVLEIVGVGIYNTNPELFRVMYSYDPNA